MVPNLLCRTWKGLSLALFPSADTCSALSMQYQARSPSDKAVPTTSKERCCDHCHICTKMPSENLYVNVF